MQCNGAGGKGMLTKKATRGVNELSTRCVGEFQAAVECAVTRKQLYTIIPTVRCNCGHAFCFGCGLDGHQPVICAVVRADLFAACNILVCCVCCPRASLFLWFGVCCSCACVDFFSPLVFCVFRAQGTFCISATHTDPAIRHPNPRTPKIRPPRSHPE